MDEETRALQKRLRREFPTANVEFSKDRTTPLLVFCYVRHCKCFFPPVEYAEVAAFVRQYAKMEMRNKLGLT